MSDNNSNNTNTPVEKTEFKPKELTPEEKEIQEKWINIQNELKTSLIEIDQIDFSIPGVGDGDNQNHKKELKYIGGVDISFVKDNQEDACAALIVLEYPSLKIVYKDIEFVKLNLPYIPGFLAFREVPHLIKLIERLKESKDNCHLVPQVLMIDGNGILHPRGFGLASHLGLLADIPTIGVGKTFFHVDNLNTKDIKQKVENERLSYLEQQKQKGNNNNKNDDMDICVKLEGESGRVWGAAILSNKSCKNPVYVSQGHRLSLDTTLKLVKLTTTYRVPESIRQADLLSRDFIRLNYKENK
ncbi:hypothetical protein DICPUDRAFT_75974 [Dictyostelium purpureum]|uniref:Endonuclease V n=1 Tax=Dictyostelium purpureum TaxID=5786 RepID=F0ZC78_DICPU|nr:uncharacterized protein DICPUDRAFT_75974 [Dictyostelium purpureum]EGC38474.1 hypothetical protein DICPUDRAFT_75974 [Dictyostelium purpureum]|eukprot:XP_003285032.1 hypothetical protein DICPUDRAFT_75974 [Dictyostelium purpureum]